MMRYFIKNASSVIEVISREETATAWLTLSEDGIVRILFKKSVEVDLPAQDENHAAFIRICGDKKRPVIYRTQDYVNFTKEARERSVLLEKTSPILASAMIPQNFGYKLLADLYIRINKPGIPTKVFSTEEEAVAWLRSLT